MDGGRWVGGRRCGCGWMGGMGGMAWNGPSVCPSIALSMEYVWLRLAGRWAGLVWSGRRIDG